MSLFGPEIFIRDSESHCAAVARCDGIGRVGGLFGTAAAEDREYGHKNKDALYDRIRANHEVKIRKKRMRNKFICILPLAGPGFGPAGEEPEPPNPDMLFFRAADGKKRLFRLRNVKFFVLLQAMFN